MTDMEIRQYLDGHSWRINAKDCVMEVFNTSPQIIDTIYDFNTKMMTIITPDNKFTFECVLGTYD